MSKNKKKVTNVDNFLQLGEFQVTEEIPTGRPRKKRKAEKSDG